MGESSECGTAQDGELVPMTRKELTKMNRIPVPAYTHQIEFQKFPKIPRYNRPIIITEKIDGTNAQILVLENGQVFAGSRSQWITPDNDHYGFAAWVQQHEAEIREVLGPGRHVGEWWGQTINRGYDLDRRCFSLFNVCRWSDKKDPAERYRHTTYQWIRGEHVEKVKVATLVPPCCNVVPILYEGPWCDDENTVLQWGEDPRMVDITLYRLSYEGSHAAPGFMKPEGIVIFHKQSGHLFKVTIENDDEPKSKGKSNA